MAKAMRGVKAAGAKGNGGDRLAWFRQDRFGMFIHWGIYAIGARGEWLKNQEQIADEVYQGYFEEFTPDRYDPVMWAKLAKAAGQKYAVITTKHHDGFCLFDSKLTDYKATNTPAGRDLIREYVDAFRGEGLKVGFYYSLLDWHHPDYPVDRLHPQRGLAEEHPFKTQKRNFANYQRYLHGQVKELLTNYGKIDLLWFDFSYGEMSGETWRAKELVEMIRKLQPGIILNNRLTAGHEDPGKRTAMGDLHTPEQIIPAEGVLNADGTPALWEACITLNRHWGYARDDQDFKTPAQVVRMLIECVSKGGNLLLNVGPTARGEIQEECYDVLLDVGQWLAVNGESIYGAGRAEGMAKPDWGRYTRKGNVLYAHIMEKPMGPILFEGLGRGKVKRVRMLSDGSEIKTDKPWNVPAESPHLFVSLPPNATFDPLSTVVKLELA